MIELVKRLKDYPLTWIVGVVIVMAFVISMMSPYFFTVGNLSNLLKQVAIIAVLAGGQTLVILSGGIDLSIGSILALSAVVIGFLIEHGYSPVTATLAGVAAGTLCGYVNGIVITKGRIAPFIATLGMMGIARGLSLVITKGVSYMVLVPFFDFIGNGTVLGLPVPIVIVLVVYAALFLLLRRTVFGRHTYAIGGNEHVSRLEGIRVDRHKVLIYTLSGFLAAIAALIMVGRLASTPPHVAKGAELEAIAAVIIGGTSFTGGVGGVELTLIGALIMAMITNALNILGISSFWQQVFIGIVIIAAVWLDNLKRQR
ncbi:MAG: ABC transporter permease [Immundisolibacterales bacterium]|nr:ABC transporter permease [Immundisolibacterales bacterium]